MMFGHLPPHSFSQSQQQQTAPPLITAPPSISTPPHSHSHSHSHRTLQPLRYAQHSQHSMFSNFQNVQNVQNVSNVHQQSLALQNNLYAPPAYNKYTKYANYYSSQQQQQYVLPPPPPPPHINMNVSYKPMIGQIVPMQTNNINHIHYHF